VEAPYKLKEAITSKVIVVKAALRLLVTLRACLKIELPLFNLRLKLAL